MKKIIACFALIAFAACNVYSQAKMNNANAEISISTDAEQYVSDNSSTELSIAGTSTLHDWESKVKEFVIKATRNGNSISANLVVQVNSIKSGKPGMDNNTYKALKESDYPTITFMAADLLIANGQTISGKGDLTIAGKTRRIPVTFSMASWLEGTITIVGEIKITMTDYGVTPPIALFGTVKTGDDIIFKINTTLKQITN